MSYINRGYTNDGLYPISLTGGRRRKKVVGGRKMRVPKMFKDAQMYIMGGNCGCSGCMAGAGFDVEALEGGNFFDWLSNQMPAILGNVPIFGTILKPVAEATLSILDPYRKNPRNPRPQEPQAPPKPEFHPTAQTGKYLTDQYNQALAQINRRPAGAGFFDNVKNFFVKHGKDLIPVGKAGYDLLYGKGNKHHKIMNKLELQLLKGGGFTDTIRNFYNKHKSTIHKAGIASASALGALATGYFGNKGYQAYDRNKWFNQHKGADGYVDV